MGRVNLSQETAETIKKIIEKQYQPGDKIPSEMQLAEFIGVSRTTIREAVKILCSQHILEIRRGNGTFVSENMGITDDLLGTADMDEEQLKTDALETCLVLQPELVRLSAVKASDESIKKMRSIHEELKDKLERYENGEYIDPQVFRKLDIAFHRAVIDGGENQIISRFLPIFLNNCIEWYSIWKTINFKKVLHSFSHYHELILEAIENHDSEAAYRYSREHTEEIISIYNGGPIYSASN